ncbi:MAG: DUF401 family protein [Candidatus Zixiibacteriota bacterium]|nr:MAG: DUF401 family protein [candidate division Zixibacteria bacterium]
MTWLGFAISLAAILIISRKNLALALTAGALLLGLFTVPPSTVVEQTIYTITSPSVIILALAVGVIPIIGGTMKNNGQIDSLVGNLRLPRRYLLALSPALMGLLPIPGGALLSAPILEKGGQGVPPDLLGAINNWFRHSFIMVYPLSSALIVATQIADLDIYRCIVWLLPGFAVAMALGWAFFLTGVDGRMGYESRFSSTGLIIPLAVILSAPALDFALKRIFDLDATATLLAVLTALTLSLLLGTGPARLRAVFKTMRPWNFSLIIVGMFLYLHMFQSSDIKHLMAALPLPPLTLAVGAGYLLGLVTGRVQLPASIVLPVYLATSDHITAPVFALVYVAIFFGFVMSPVHPCLVVTGEYFQVPLSRLVNRLTIPSLLIAAAAVALSIIA